MRTRAVLNSVSLVTPSVATYETAGLLDPTPMRSLDALHLAAALEFGDELEGLVTYDARLGEAAGIPGDARGRSVIRSRGQCGGA